MKTWVLTLLILLVVMVALVYPAEPKKGSEHLYLEVIMETAKEHKVDYTLIQAIIMAESTYNPKAVSKRGAGGLMQLMPETAKSLGVRDIFDPAQNIWGGTRYFKQLLDRFDGSVHLALAAYNAGKANVLRYKGVPPFKVTRRYILKVLRYQEYYERIQKGGDKYGVF